MIERENNFLENRKKQLEQEIEREEVLNEQKQSKIKFNGRIVHKGRRVGEGSLIHQRGVLRKDL